MTHGRVEFKNTAPIYMQIADIIKARIIKGELTPKERLLSVREMASQIGANPNTVQKAYSVLLNEGYIELKRGIGYFVVNDMNFIREKRKGMLGEFAEEVKNRLKHMGFTIEEFKREL